MQRGFDGREGSKGGWKGVCALPRIAGGREGRDGVPEEQYCILNDYLYSRYYYTLSNMA